MMRALWREVVLGIGGGLIIAGGLLVAGVLGDVLERLVAPERFACGQYDPRATHMPATCPDAGVEQE